MKDKIIDALRNERSLTTKEIALKVGKTKAKDVQRTLNKLLRDDTIMKSKANNNLMWSLTIEQFDSNDELVKSFDDRNKFTQTTINHDSSDTFKNITVNEPMQTLNINQKEEIAFLRGEIKEKNDLIKS